MKKKKDMDIIVLEISGENGNLKDYQRALCEASLLGINKIMFCCIWDNNQDEGEKILDKLIDNLKSLNITPMNTSIGYAKELFHGPMVGRSDALGYLESFGNLIPFNEYKASKGIVIEEEQIAKVFAKI